MPRIPHELMRRVARSIFVASDSIVEEATVVADHLVDGSGLSLFCEILAGALTGGLASNPRAPTADRLVNNMLSLVFDPSAFGDGGAFEADVRRLIDWVKASAPISPG